MSSRVKYSDGFEIRNGDANNAQQFLRKTLFDEVLMSMSGVNGLGSQIVPMTGGGSFNDAAILRPWGYSGAMARFSSTVVRVNGGMWFYKPAATVDADAPVCRVAATLAYTDLTVTGFAGLGGNFRRDIIQARVVEADESAVSRDFKDATTGVISSQTTVVRANATVDLALKQGSPSATLAGVTEPTADSGYFKIGSVLVRSTGIDNNDETYDWRIPMGDRVFLTRPHAMVTPSGAGGWDLTRLTEGWARVANTAAGNRLECFCDIDSLNLVTYSSGSMSGHHGAAKRVMQVRAITDLVANPGANDIGFLRVPHYGTYANPGSAAAIWNVSVGTRATLTAGNVAKLLDTPDPPLWTNGYFSQMMFAPTYATSGLQLFFESVSINDKVFGVEWSLAG